MIDLQVIQNITQQLKQLKSMSNFQTNNTLQVFEELKSMIQDAISAHINVNFDVVGNVAKAVVTTEQIENQIEKAKNVIQEMETISSSSSEVPILMALNLGDAPLNEISIELPRGIFEHLTNAGVNLLQLHVSGVSIVLDPSMIRDDVILTIDAASTQIALTNPNQIQLSYVYSINLMKKSEKQSAYNGMSVHTLGVERIPGKMLIKLPVLLSFVKDVNQLAVVKSQNGKQEFISGRLSRSNQSVELFVNPMEVASYTVTYNPIDVNVKSNSVITQSVKSFLAKGIYKPVSKKTIVMNQKMTRKQLAMLIDKAFGLSQPITVFMYKDVKRSDVAYRSVQSLDRLGIMTSSGNSFGANSYVSRESYAMILSKLVRTLDNVKGLTALQAINTIKDYTDASKIKPSNKQAVATVVSLGLMDKSLKGFNPNGIVTLSDVMVSLNKLLVK